MLLLLMPPEAKSLLLLKEPRVHLIRRIVIQHAKKRGSRFPALTLREKIYMQWLAEIQMKEEENKKVDYYDREVMIDEQEFIETTYEACDVREAVAL